MEEDEENMKALLYIMFLQVIDILTMKIALERGGIELNILYHVIGFELFALVKIASSFIIAFIYYYSQSRTTRASILVIYTAIMLYGILSNVYTALF
ncbi:MAG: DUF5658 family protein [Desulfurococcaceae archaeon]